METMFIGRYEPCYILRDNSFPCVLWCEDAIAQYGVPTVLFDLHVLVPDIDEAAGILQRQGWILEDGPGANLENPMVHGVHHRLTPPTNTRNTERSPDLSTAQSPTTTILLSASEWNFEISSKSCSFVPSLPKLVDGLLQKLLDDSLADNLWHHLAVFLGYLYDHTPALQDRYFADQLKYEHRQYHYDVLSGMSPGTLSFIRHEQKIRDALMEGKFVLCECSADRDDHLLFNRDVQARIAASMDSCFTPEDYEADETRIKEEEEEKVYWLAKESEEMKD